MTKRNVLLLLVCIALLIPNFVFAHGMLLQLVEPGVLKAEYDGGGFSPRTEVVLYDEAGNELASGPVDENGEFHFDKELAVHSAVANDGMGHQAEYKEGVVEKSIPKLPVVIGVFAVIGGVFAVYNKKSKA